MARPNWLKWLPGASVPTGPTTPTTVVASTVAISDGNTTANVISGDSGNNAQVVTGGRKEVTFSTTTVQAVAVTDVSNYASVSVWINTQGGSSTVAFQISNDNSTWFNHGLQSISSSVNGSATSTTSAGIMFYGPLPARYFRLNVTGIISGTTAGTVEFFSLARPNFTNGAYGGVSEGGALSGNPVRFGISDNTNIRTPQTATGASNSAALGLLGVGNMGFDGTNYQLVGGVVGDSGQNSLVVSGSRKEVSFTTTTVQPVASTDVSNYRWVSVHITSQGASATVTFQGSNDNSNWIAVPLVQQSVTTTSTTSTGSAGVIFDGPLGFRYFRLNVTGISSGTTAGICEFLAVPTGLRAGGVTAAIQKAATATNSPSTDASFGSVTNNSSKASSGNVFSLHVSSVNTSLVYFQLHNKASAPTSGNAPIYSFPLGAATASSPTVLIVGESFFGLAGKNFATGVAWGISSVNATFTDAGTAANYNVHLHYT